MPHKKDEKTVGELALELAPDVGLAMPTEVAEQLEIEYAVGLRTDIRETLAIRRFLRHALKDINAQIEEIKSGKVIKVGSAQRETDQRLMGSAIVASWVLANIGTINMMLANVGIPEDVDSLPPGGHA